MAQQVLLLNAVQPDVVVVTGDSVSGYAWNGTSTDFYYNAWTNWTLAFIQEETRYAYALGNHDNGGDLTREQIVALDQSNPYSLTQASTGIEGVTNYVLPIFSLFNSSYPSANIWIFDSHDNGCELSPFGWGCIWDDQVSWYEAKSKEITEQYGRSGMGLAFYHIPTPEWKELYNNGLFYGNRYEAICCPLVNTGLVAAAQKMGDITGMFCGHDHDNDYGGFSGNVEIVYGRKTGFGGYGPVPEIQRGARVIQLTEYLDDQNNIQVNRTHWIIDGNLSLETNETWRTREGSEYQYICGVGGSPAWMFMFTAGGVVAGSTLIYIAYKYLSFN